MQAARNPSTRNHCQLLRSAGWLIQPALCGAHFVASPLVHFEMCWRGFPCSTNLQKNGATTSIGCRICFIIPCCLLEGIYHYRKYSFLFFLGGLSTWKSTVPKQRQVAQMSPNKPPCFQASHSTPREASVQHLSPGPGGFLWQKSLSGFLVVDLKGAL